VCRRIIVTQMGELARLFLKLGSTSFGGPAVHIAMMRDEVVERRGWMSDQEFLDLMGATNLIPGPNSTELAIHVGRIRAGIRGLLIAGACFILPAVIIVLGFAWAYVEYGTTPAGEALLYGIEPMVIAIVAIALVGLGRTAMKDAWLTGAGIASLALYLAGVNELIVLFGVGALAMVIRTFPEVRTRAPLVAPMPLAQLAVQVESVRDVGLDRLFLVFLKVGALLYGSGYVLLAFLRGDLVDGFGWLTDAQLTDAVAVGQMTPGPLFSTATFVGYVLGGLPGAGVATLGIFLPSFVFVAATGPLVRRARDSVWTAAFLDGVNVAAIGLMAGVTWQLAGDAIVDVPTAVLFLVALAVLLRFRLNSAWIVLAGAGAGLALSYAGAI
jgi:chromate transporter